MEGEGPPVSSWLQMHCDCFVQLSAHAQGMALKLHDKFIPAVFTSAALFLHSRNPPSVFCRVTTLQLGLYAPTSDSTGTKPVGSQANPNP